MKKLSFALALTVALIAGQAYAAQPISVSSKSQVAVGSGGKGSMTNTIMETKVKESTVITSGRGAETNISRIDNKGGSMTNTIMETEVNRSTIITSGDGAETNIGRINNQ